MGLFFHFYPLSHPPKMSSKVFFGLSSMVISAIPVGIAYQIFGIRATRILPVHGTVYILSLMALYLSYDYLTRIHSRRLNIQRSKAVNNSHVASVKSSDEYKSKSTSEIMAAERQKQIRTNQFEAMSYSLLFTNICVGFLFLLGHFVLFSTFLPLWRYILTVLLGPIAFGVLFGSLGKKINPYTKISSFYLLYQM